jgi:uncharacterized repeat protein (TIGR02543 family)
MRYLKSFSIIAVILLTITGCHIDITPTSVTYRVYYHGNGNTNGSEPTDYTYYANGEYVTVLGKNTLSKTGYTFAGWNTLSNGTGTDYHTGDDLLMGSSTVDLYAMWTSSTPYYNVYYNGNGNTGGSAPTDAYSYASGEYVTVMGKGTLVKTDFSFAGWNTSSSGTGTSYNTGSSLTMGNSDKTLYAMWTDNYYIDSYVTISSVVKRLIADSVIGYTMPPVATYGTDIYPASAVRDESNLPSYVKADFNNDGYYDYAYMFSRVSSSGGLYTQSTKFIIVVSTETSYDIALYDKLSTTSNTKPTEEYWGIRLLKAGTHTVTIDGKEVSVELTNPGLYLGSVEPAQRTLIYIENEKGKKERIDLGAIPKKKISSPDGSSQLIIKALKVQSCD